PVDSVLAVRRPQGHTCSKLLSAGDRLVPYADNSTPEAGRSLAPTRPRSRSWQCVRVDDHPERVPLRAGVGLSTPAFCRFVPNTRKRQGGPTRYMRTDPI